MTGRFVSTRQRGVALLAAVLVVALATILIAGLLDRGSLGQSRALQHTRASQAFAFQQGLELWAARILRDDADRTGNDSRNNAWAQPMPPIPVPDGMIHGRMRDLDGCLNLNALTVNGIDDAITVRRFERLLRVLELNPRLTEVVLDWIDEDGVARSGGGEDVAYLALDPPRRTGNQPLAHVSELRAMLGVDAQTYQRLAPHVCARPDATNTMNINTASAELLMSLDDAIGPALARRLYADGRADYASASDFREHLEQNEAVQLAPNALQGVVVNSRYFVAEADVLMSEVPVRLYSLLERDQSRIRVLARSQGRYD